MSIRLFIADTDKTHIQNITRGVSRCPDIRVVGTDANGAHALKQLSITPADMLVSEVQLPGLDGLMLLRDLQTLPHPPGVIMCTHFQSTDCVSKACAYGAAFFMYKPLDYHRLLDIIRECHRARLQRAVGNGLPDPSGRTSAEERARALMLSSGMPLNLNGSMYLYEALLSAHADPTLMKNLSKGLYAAVAERTRSNPARVERSLRNAIAIAYERSGLESRFPRCPTNREFLLYMLAQLDSRL